MLYLRDTEQKINDSKVYFAECYNYDADFKNTVKFKECKFIAVDKGYQLLGYAEQINSVKEGKTDFKDTGFICLVFHNEPYERYSFKEKKNETVQPSGIENLLNFAITNGNIQLDTCYQGYFMIRENPSVDWVLNGQTTDTAMIQNVVGSTFSFTACDPLLLKDVGVINVAGSNNGNTTFKKGETTLDRLTLKEQFIVNSVNQLHVKHNGFNSYADITLWMSDPLVTDDTVEVVKNHLNLLSKLT